MSDENDENQEEESFPLEKILKTSIKDYCNMVGRRINEYKPVGVHVTYITKGNDCGSFTIGRFVKFVPENAEIVVEFQYLESNAFPFKYAYGTALIPKEKKDGEKND